MKFKFFLKNIFFLKIQILIVSGFLFLAVAQGQTSLDSEILAQGVLVESKPSVHRLTVFIHGTILPVPSAHAFKYVAKHVAKNGIKNFKSAYQDYLDGRRDKKGLYGYQPIGKKGLTQIVQSYPEGCAYTQASQLLRDIFVAHNRDMKIEEKCSYYLFGWDGRLEHQNRIEWAQHLHRALCDEVKNIKEVSGVDHVCIDIFAHSHGGNVALLLAQAQELSQDYLSIDRLVMLGTPIQQETEKYVLDPMFKNAYLVYSQGDTTQVLDVFSTKGRSKRRFEGEDERKKVIHIEVTIDGKQTSHGELWSYGMVGEIIYRKKLSIYPLPIVAFMPYIFHNMDCKLVPGSTLKIDVSRMWDDFGWPKIQPKDCFCIKYDAPQFISKSMIQINTIPESNRILFPEQSFPRHLKKI